YGAQRTYVLQLSADIDNVSTKEAATIRFFVPRPLISASQPSAELIESTPEPAIPNYQNAVVHQIQVTRNVPKRQFSQNFVVSVSEINTSVNVPVVRSYSSMNKELFALATKADKSVPASATSVTSLAKSIVGQETNPYKKARLIYEYMLSNYSLSNNKSNDSLDLIRRRRGNSYDFAIIYTSLLRSVGVPAFPVAGVLVERDMQTRNHWWCEFYITSLGWVPVDVALGAGLEYRNWINTEDVSEYYFGNLDAQHIAFSRGWNEIKPTSENSIIVQQQHSYAFQSIWEEASQSTIKYSSFWQNPIVLGIY
ncbi:MAG: transglutaminase domain-containing protein, partial [Treponema sp.]|nr:transglutaminase domain-containing protein [Treponema sp.]